MKLTTGCHSILSARSLSAKMAANGIGSKRAQKRLFIENAVISNPCKQEKKQGKTGSS